VRVRIRRGQTSRIASWLAGTRGHENLTVSQNAPSDFKEWNMVAERPSDSIAKIKRLLASGKTVWVKTATLGGFGRYYWR
jgi:hypothetical protein